MVLTSLPNGSPGLTREAAVVLCEPGPEDDKEKRLTVETSCPKLIVPPTRTDSVKTNELKKGTRVQLRNGWEADIADNARGNTRMCTVYGTYTEMGSVYSHDIMFYRDALGAWRPVEHTPAQLQLRSKTRTLGF